MVYLVLERPLSSQEDSLFLHRTEARFPAPTFGRLTTHSHSSSRGLQFQRSNTPFRHLWASKFRTAYTQIENK